MKCKEDIESIQALKRDGYTNTQIAEMKGISTRTVFRLLKVNADMLCVDGSSIHNRRTSLNKYRAIIQEMIEQDFKSAQIRKKLQVLYPDETFKRSTVNDYCLRIRGEIYNFVVQSNQSVAELSESSILIPFKEDIDKMIAERSTVAEIFAFIHNKGYLGSYSLLQQYFNLLKPVIRKIKKNTHSISRKNIGIEIWKRALATELGDGNTESKVADNDIKYIRSNFPEYIELETIIKEFRVSYSNKDVGAVERWVDTYHDCKFQSIISFINGIKKDSVAFYNSMKYEYNNGLLEGSVNKLKEIKRTMYGRASYTLLRAKILLTNKSMFPF